MDEPIVIGIDPGSHYTGYGIVQDQKGEQTYLASGRLQVKGSDCASRLFYIFSELQQLIERYKPNVMAIEHVFFHLNAQSALKLGQARGAALVAAASAQLSTAEYSPRQVKKTVAGTGAATKAQVQYMVRLLLKIKETLSEDASDALAIAICHCQTRRLARKLV